MWGASEVVDTIADVRVCVCNSVGGALRSLIATAVTL